MLISQKNRKTNMEVQADSLGIPSPHAAPAPDTIHSPPPLAGSRHSGPGDGSREWVQGMGPGNGSRRWVQGMAPGDGWPQVNIAKC